MCRKTGFERNTAIIRNQAAWIFILLIFGAYFRIKKVFDSKYTFLISERNLLIWKNGFCINIIMHFIYDIKNEYLDKTI